MSLRERVLQKLKLCGRHVRVEWQGRVLAESKDAYWVLETTHPPTYYIPLKDCATEHFQMTSKRTFCEWKGQATYFSIKVGEHGVDNRAWCYSKPTQKFKPIADYVSFYAGPWDCFVNGEKVVPQPGDFYGGWLTSDIDVGTKGPKGGPGTWGW